MQQQAGRKHALQVIGQRAHSAKTNVGASASRPAARSADARASGSRRSLGSKWYRSEDTVPAHVKVQGARVQG